MRSGRRRSALDGRGGRAYPLDELGNAFNFLGVPPVIGRTIQPTDIAPNGDADPIAYVAVAALGFVTLVACYIPARRAAAVDPIVALRQE